MKTEEKKKVGRPRKENKEKKIRVIYISDADHQFYTAHGNGNFSKGVQVVKEILSKLKT